MIKQAYIYFETFNICPVDDDIVNFLCDESFDGNWEEANRAYDEWEGINEK